MCGDVGEVAMLGMMNARPFDALAGKRLWCLRHGTLQGGKWYPGRDYWKTQCRRTGFREWL
jgi:hypothetical protein